MIDIKYVEFKNFLSFGNAFQRYDFEPGIDLIIGWNVDNQKSNGSGKSNVLEALVFGLFGQPTKDITKPGLVNWKNRKKTEVRVCFERNGSEYVIHRGIKPNILKVFKDGTEVDQPAHVKDFQAEIEENMLGIDQQAIRLIHCNQNNSQSIFDMSKPQKRAFIERMFGLGEYSEATKKCNEKINEKKAALNDIVLRDEFSEKSIESYTDQAAKFEASLESIKSHKEEIKGIKEKLAKIDAKETEFADYLMESADRISGLKERKQGLSAELSEAHELKARIEGKISSIDIRETTFDLDKHEQMIDKHKKLAAKIAAFDCEAAKRLSSELIARREELIGLKEKAKARVWSAEKQERSLKEPSELDGMAECPTCGHEIDHDKIKDELDKALSDLEAERLAAQSEVDSLSEDIDEVEASLKEQNDLIEANSVAESTLTRLESAIERSIRDKAEFDRYEARKSELETLKKELDAVNHSIDSLFDESTSVNADIESISSRRNEIESVLARREPLNERLASFEEAEVENARRRKELKDYIAENEQKSEEERKLIKQRAAESKKIKTMIDHFEFVKSMCKDENVKQYAISNIVPFLNKKANEYISEAGFPFYLKLDNWLNVVIKGPGITDGTYGNLSSGQQKTTNLAMMLAFIDVAKKMSPEFPNVLLLDEILDSAIDGQSINLMMQIIRRKQQDDGTKVIIVSHRSEVSETDFDRVKKVTMKNGFSTIGEGDS